MGDTDITLRELAGKLIGDLAYGLGASEDAKIFSAETSLPASERRADKFCFVLEALVLYILHVEIEAELKSGMGFRVFEYSSRAHASASHVLPAGICGDEKAGSPLPVRSVVLALSGPDNQCTGMIHRSVCGRRGIVYWRA